MDSDPAVNAPDLRSPAEFTRFYRVHLPAVYGYLFRLCGNDRSLAEDLTQDTGMALANEIRRGRLDCADIRWLMTVARSRFPDHARRERRLESDRRRLLLAVPPATERRLFDRRAADRANEQTQSRATGAPVRKGLLIDIYV